MILVFIFLAFLSCTGVAAADVAPATIPPIDSTEIPALPAKITADLDRFYALRNNHPAWNLSDEAALKRALAFIDSVEALTTYHGLEKAPYKLADMRALISSASDSDKQKLEELITASLLRLTHDLHGDSVDLEHLYTGWAFHRAEMDIPATLNVALTNGTLDKFFDEKLAPQAPEYAALAKALQTYSTIEAKGEWQSIDAGKPLHPQDRDNRIIQLRARLAAEGYVIPTPADGQSDVFDKNLGKVLMIYQIRNGLQPDGHLGPKTQEALNTPVAARIAQIRANMERWRHMPETFPPARYAQVNIPDFTIKLVDDNQEIYRGLVVDGRADRQTPFIDSKIVNMVINPSWHVPETLARKDILPKLRKDPHYLEKLGFEIKGRDEDPAGVNIDWKKVSDSKFPYQLRQIPGDMNSLGQLKFNFDNPFAVYMHGTPHQELFARAERSFSSGCVRLEEPERVGELLLSSNHDKGGWPAQRIADEIDAGKTLFIPLAKPMPLVFVYWSVFSGDDGQINFRKDIYGYDSSLIDSMKNMP